MYNYFGRYMRYKAYYLEESHEVEETINQLARQVEDNSEMANLSEKLK